MRDYCRVFHTSLDYVSSIPLARMLEEFAEAAEELDEERRQREKQMKLQQAKAKTQSKSRSKHRRR